MIQIGDISPPPWADLLMFIASGFRSTAKAVGTKIAMRRRRTVILVGRFLRVGGSSLLFVVVIILPFVVGLEDPGKYA